MNTVQDIRSGSIVFVWGTGWLGKIIAWYQKWDTKVKGTPSHVEIYFGSGKREDVSAESNGVKKVSFERLITKGHKVEVYSFKGMTVDQLQDLKAFGYSRVGIVPYDYIGLVGFLFKMIKLKPPQLAIANFCSEFVADCFNYIGIQLTEKELPSSAQHPGAQWVHIKDNPNWTLDFKYENL